MPGPEAAYGPESGIEDLFPEDSDDEKKLISWCQNAFTAAEKAKSSYVENWERYYKQYRAFVKHDPEDWHSKMFVPMVFWVVETVAPRLVAQLPRFLVLPVGEEDVEPAKMMEQLMDWSATKSDLFLELVKAVKSALKYGTGLLKTYHKVVTYRARKMVPQYEDVLAPQISTLRAPEGSAFMDLNGQAMQQTEQMPIGRIQVGYEVERYSYVGYDGPAAEWVDIWNFFPAPEADDVQSSRYCIHRVYRELRHVQKMVESGVYRWPDNMTPKEMTETADEPLKKRLESIDLGPSDTDPTRKPIEILEFYTDDGRLITMANRKALLRVSENPYDHGMKPFVRFVDQLVEGEFWGIGEIEPLEGLQDQLNAITNQRIDNLRLILNAMFGITENAIADMDELESRPGGMIRVTGDRVPSEVIMPIVFPDVTGSSYEETREIMDTAERASATSAYQTGVSSDSLADTATGTAIIQEQGATRYALKTTLMELMGLKDLGRMYGSIIQQFTTEERVIRILGPRGQILFQTFDPESIQGSLDYDIETASTQLTESSQREQALTLLEVLSQYLPPTVDPMTGQPMPGPGVQKLVEDVLVAYKKKDLDAYMVGPQTEMGQPGLMAPPGVPAGPLPPGMAPAPAPGPGGVDLSQALAGAPVA